MMTGNSDPNQCALILDYLQKHGSITQREATIHLCVGRLPSRVFEMRQMGIPIYGKMETGKNAMGKTCRYKRYFLEEENGGNGNGV